MRSFTPVFLLALCLTQTARSQEPLATGFAGTDNCSLKPVPGLTDPPDGPVRAMAEWEEIQAVVITWHSFKPILAQIVNAVKAECRVLIITNNIATCQAELTGFNVDWQTGGNVEFLVAPYNTLWIRDYGPSTVYGNGVDSLLLLDWIYNRPYPKDNLIPGFVGNYLGLPVYSTTVAPYDLVHPGGNNFTDGMGTNFSSKLILQENGPGNVWGTSEHTEAGVDSIMRRFYGIERYIKFDTLPFDGIHHIDMHMKLLDEETLLVGEYPEGVPDRDQIEANLQYLTANFMTPFGTQYNVVRIPMPPDMGFYPSDGAPLRTYVNSLIVNKTVLVPLYEEQYDTTALRIWHDNMPGYNIVGIPCNAIIPLRGAVHCIVKEVGVADPLLIQHQQVADFVDVNPSSYAVTAWIRHRSGVAGAEVFYTTDTAAGYQPLPMTLTDTAANLWTGWIPQQPYGSTIHYYFHATAQSGKEQFRPMPAPAAYFDFRVRLSMTTEEIVDAPRLGAVFPNPAHGLTCVPVYAGAGGNAALELTDCFGRRIQTLFNGMLPVGGSRYFFQAGGYPSGIYLIRLQTSRSVFVQKVVIGR